MTLQTLVTILTIILVFFGVLFIGGLLFIMFLLGKRTVKNNPEKALLLVKNGLETAAFKGKLHEKTDLGVNYNYNKTSVFVPKTYQEIYHKNRRLLFLGNLGQLIASPFDDDVTLTSTEKEALIYELVSSHIGADGLRALKGKSTSNVIIIAIVAFVVGAVIVFGVMSYRENTMTQSQINKSANVTSQKALPTPIEVK